MNTIDKVNTVKKKEKPRHWTELERQRLYQYCGRNHTFEKKKEKSQHLVKECNNCHRKNHFANCCKEHKDSRTYRNHQNQSREVKRTGRRSSTISEHEGFIRKMTK